MRARLLVVLITAVVVAGCSNLTSEEGGLDVDAILGDFRDCEQLVDVFMGLVVEATRQVDRLAIEGVSVDVEQAVESLDADRFFEGTRGLGCNQDDTAALVVARLEEIRPGTASGSAFVQTLEQVIASR